VLNNAPATLALIDEVGLSSKMLPSRDSARRRYVYRSGRLHEVPVSVGAFVTSGLLSVRGKLGVALEPFTRRAPLGDETIREFAERHIGREAADVLVGAMVSGIFAGDAAALSLQACFPKMWEMEHEHGTLVRALIARRKERRAGPGLGSPSGRLVSFTGGMADLARRGGALGPAVHTGCGVIAVREWRAEEVSPLGARGPVRAGGRSIEADALVLAGPSRWRPISCGQSTRRWRSSRKGRRRAACRRLPRV
jgi:oxygen-dependent protoporphyrinogen oxidase